MFSNRKAKTKTRNYIDTYMTRSEKLQAESCVQLS